MALGTYPALSQHKLHGANDSVEVASSVIERLRQDIIPVPK